MDALPKGGDIPCALFFPADYAVGSANLGIHAIFKGLREQGVGVERFFASPHRLRSVDTDARLDNFRLLLAGVSYEGDIPSFYRWLMDAKIPLSLDEREEGNHPLIGAGGAISYINPLSLSGVCDFIVLGDALPLLGFLIQEIRAWGVDGNRARLLESLASHGNILVPSVHLKKSTSAHSLRVSTEKMSEKPLFNSWLTPRSVFGRTLLLEIQRGCCRRCAYCVLPACYAPPRQGGIDGILGTLERLAASHRFDQVGLVTPEAGDYPHLPRILEKLEALDKGVSFASLRADALTSPMVKALVRGGRRSVTLAPETGGDVLRARCGKNFSNDRLIEALQLAQQHGVTQAKLYFMVGLPGEMAENIDEIPLLCRRIQDETPLAIHLSVGVFVPKPGTPWEREPFGRARELKNKYQALISGLRRHLKKQPVLSLTSVKEAKKEFLLSWADHRLSGEYAAQIEGNGSEMPVRNSREETIEQLTRLGLR